MEIKFKNVCQSDFRKPKRCTCASNIIFAKDGKEDRIMERNQRKGEGQEGARDKEGPMKGKSSILNFKVTWKGSNGTDK